MLKSIVSCASGPGYWRCGLREDLKKRRICRPVAAGQWKGDGEKRKSQRYSFLYNPACDTIIESIRLNLFS